MSGSSGAQSLGIVSMIWGGQKFNLDSKTCTFTLGGLTADAVVAGQAVYMAQKFMQGTVKANIPLARGMSLAQFIALNGSEMQVQCDSGQKYVSQNAFLSKDPSVKSGAGSNISAEWASQPFVESLS